MCFPYQQDCRQISLQRHASSTAPSRQSGSSLLITLLLVAIMSLSAIAMYSNSLIEQRSSHHILAKSITYQDAERVLNTLLAQPRDAWQLWFPDQLETPTKQLTANFVDIAGDGIDSSLQLTLLAINNNPSFDEMLAGNDGNVVQHTVEAIAQSRYGAASSTHRMRIMADFMRDSTPDHQPFD